MKFINVLLIQVSKFESKKDWTNTETSWLIIDGWMFELFIDAQPQ